MAVDDVPLDDKAKRMRDLLSSFYSQDPSSNSALPNASSRYATLDTINTTNFDADQYMNLLVQKANLEGLLQRHVEMAAEIKNLDTDLQMLVYENYNKFIGATETIKRMNSNIVGMEANMEQLLEKIMSVQSRSDGVNTSLFEKREHIEKLHRTRNLLRKVQFIYDLPSRLQKCIKSEAYADAVRLYNGAMPIFEAYGESSFQDCKRASEEAVTIVIEKLQGKVFSDSESIHSRAEAVMLLKQLSFPVENLKAKLLEKLEQYVLELHRESSETSDGSVVADESTKQGNVSDSSSSAAAHEASVREFAEAVRASKAIFPDSGQQLVKLAQDLIKKHFGATQQNIKRHIRSTKLLELLRLIWSDVLLMDEVLPEASLVDFSLELARVASKQYIDSTFSLLLLDISDSLIKVESRQKEGVEGFLEGALEASKKTVIQGGLDILLEFRQLLDENLEVLIKLRDHIIDWVQEGFQAFFKKLDAQFILLSGKKNCDNPDLGLTKSMHGDKNCAGLVLLLAQLSVFIEQSAIPRITEEVAASFSGGGIRGYEHGPAFVPVEICRMFRSASEKLLNHYISMRTQRVSVLLRKRFTTPNWFKHKEPREVHMFVDLFCHEFEAIEAEVKQILPQGHYPRHRRTESNGSTTSSRGNPLNSDKLTRSNTQKARSQLLETHLAKLFKQKMEIFTKVEHAKESVLTTILKLALKSLQEFVRLQTFNRSGFQQIQLDVQYLRTVLKETAEDEAAFDFLLDEVIVSAAERCLDPIPLEPPILDKLIQAKLEKTLEHNPSS